MLAPIQHMSSELLRRTHRSHRRVRATASRNALIPQCPAGALTSRPIPGAELMVLAPSCPGTPQPQLQRCCAHRRELEEPQHSAAPFLTRSITNEIKQCNSLPELSDLMNRWGSSFDHIHASAAFTQTANLAGNRQATGSQQKLLAPLLGNLSIIWASVQPNAQARGLSSVLWACSKLGWYDGELWSSTLTAFTSQVKTAKCRNLSNVAYALGLAASANKGSVPGCAKEKVQQAMRAILDPAYVLVTNPQLEDITPQDISNLLWACSKLQLNPGEAEVAALMQAFVKPHMLEQDTSQGVANILHSLSVLRDYCDLRNANPERCWQKLLGSRQLAQMGRSRNPQHISNTLLALARLASTHEIRADLAKSSAIKLLQHAPTWNLRDWPSQEVSNTLWACDRFGLAHQAFLQQVADSAVHWVPQCTAAEVAQAAGAVGIVHYSNQPLMVRLASRSKQILSHAHISAPARNVTGLAATVGLSIAQLDMRQLAPSAIELVQNAAVQGQLCRGLHDKHAAKFYGLHEWLVRNHLLDGRGLAGLISAEHLAKGEELAGLDQQGDLDHHVPAEDGHTSDA